MAKVVPLAEALLASLLQRLSERHRDEAIAAGKRLAERITSTAAAAPNPEGELRGSDPKVSTLLKLRKALADVGIEFIDAADGKGEGVRLKDGRASEGKALISS